MQEQREIVVVAGGPGPPLGAALARDAFVIAADGGLDRCHALGLRADLVVGDLDSVDPAALEAAERDGATVQQHPRRKDATDLELALDEALSRGACRVTVVASAEGRLDHLASSLQLLAADRYASLEVDALVGEARVHVVRATRTIPGTPGALLTLLAAHGPAGGVRTEGLEYRLDGETLAPGSSRGVSNVFAAPIATVSVERGVLLAILPGGGAP